MKKSRRMAIIKKLLAALLVVAVLREISLYLFYYEDFGKKEVFQLYNEDFELIKDFFFSLTPEDEGYDPIGYGVVYDQETHRFALRNPPAKWGEEEEIALNHIAEIFTGIWNDPYIRVEPDRISFEGLGKEFVVYSAKGKRPKYFYEEGDGVPFGVERLDKNWFFLRHFIR